MTIISEVRLILQLILQKKEEEKKKIKKKKIIFFFLIFNINFFNILSV